MRPDDIATLVVIGLLIALLLAFPIVGYVFDPFLHPGRFGKFKVWVAGSSLAIWRWLHNT